MSVLTNGSYWRHKAHEIINPSYDNAINNYNIQKQRFLKGLNKETSEEAEQFLEEINMELEQEAIKDLDKQFDEVLDQIEDNIIKFYQNLISGQDSNNTLVEAQQRLNSLYKRQTNFENTYKNMKQDLEHYLMTNNITRSNFLENISVNNLNLNKNNTDIVNNLYGYARKALLFQLEQNKANIKRENYKMALRGYFKEELVVKSFQKALEKYGYTAIPTGSVTDSQGHQSITDIGIGTLKLQTIIKGKNNNSNLNMLLNRLESINKNISETSSVTSLPLKGGIQVKNWTIDLEAGAKPNPKIYLPLGVKANLMPQGQDAHYWHAGVYNVMSNILDVIGYNNFIFATGNQIYWTSEFLTSLKNMSYVLAFYWSKSEEKIVSPDVKILYHND